ncbi:MAG TPA: nucleotide sugar dehydrogenase [Thermoleophilaceae bacterium]|nr:nucleotide sugar dehydrogenase [Thermoleophilaceae bacterium]
MPDREPIGVIGVGWVGLVTAACFAELGHEVHCRDIVQEKVDALSRGELPIFEPGLPELVERGRERLHFTTDMNQVLSAAKLLFCCVDTPPTYSGDADLSRVERVLEEIGGSPDHALVMKSTVPVGTGSSIRRRSNGLGYVSNPEFLKEGSAVQDFMNPDRVVVGADGQSAPFAERVAALYEPLGAPIVRTDVASAEMIKLASNAFLATKISFINEIANVSEELGADVNEVARGMGLDERIGPQFLKAGIGYGGSCLVGEETLLVRRYGRTSLLSLEALWDLLESEGHNGSEGLIEPVGMEVLSWVPGDDKPRFMPISMLTRRHYEGSLVEVGTKMGRRVRCTPDHPWIVGTGRPDGELRFKLAEELDENDWLPLAQGTEAEEDPALLSMLSAIEPAGLDFTEVRVRLARAQFDALLAKPVEERAVALAGHPRGHAARMGDIRRTGTLNFAELALLGLSERGSTVGTARNGAFIRSEVEIDESFWRVVGLYLAEGHCHRDTSGRGRSERIIWSFHPTREEHLVREVVDYWARQGVTARVGTTPTSRTVVVSSRLAGSWWIEVLGLGRTSYEQRLPDLIWDQSIPRKRALLSGLWEGDGSWSLVNGGPSVILEWGTISDDLADGVMRLLGDLGIVASRRIGRTPKSTKDTHWVRIAGANQIERMIELVPERDRTGARASIARQKKRNASTGFRKFDFGPAWLRAAKLARRPFRGFVYSLEVPVAHTWVASGGLMIKNCFPKDVSALKQLAGNTGYHFQLLTAVIEVNELQKRRTVSKLKKHLGSLVGKEIALLGVAFKPNTDDIREATSLVLAGRLQGEGASVRAYDPVAGDRAESALGGGVRIAESAKEALEGADAAVLVTEWPEFGELDWENEVKHLMATPLIVDGRNFLDREKLTSAGFTYEGVGR